MLIDEGVDEGRRWLRLRSVVAGGQRSARAHRLDQLDRFCSIPIGHHNDAAHAEVLERLVATGTDCACVMYTSSEMNKEHYCDVLHAPSVIRQLEEAQLRGEHAGWVVQHLEWLFFLFLLLFLLALGALALLPMTK